MQLQRGGGGGGGGGGGWESIRKGIDDSNISCRSIRTAGRVHELQARNAARQRPARVRSPDAYQEPSGVHNEEVKSEPQHS